MAKHLNRAAPSSTTSNISDQALTPDEPRVSTKSAGTARSALPATADSSDARPIRRLPAYRTWVPALLIWILSCAVHFGIFALSLSRDLQHPMSKVNRNLDYLSYLNIWDALFYERIYKHGYPQELPFLPDGTVNHNTWAFMPLQPMLSGGVSNVFGIDYRLASVMVTLAAGCALSLVLYRLFVGSLNWSARGVFDARPQAGDESRNRLALWALAVYALSPASPIFVTGYAEALSTLFLALCAWCVVRNRYLLLLPVALCAALSRPVGVPLGAFVGLWWLWCTVADYRDRTGGILRLSLADAWAAFRGRLGQLLSALVVCSFAFVHPLHAALRTGRPDAYSRRNWDGAVASLKRDTSSLSSGSSNGTNTLADPFPGKSWRYSSWRSSWASTGGFRSRAIVPCYTPHCGCGRPATPDTSSSSGSPLPPRLVSSCRCLPSPCWWPPICPRVASTARGWSFSGCWPPLRGSTCSGEARIPLGTFGLSPRNLSREIYPRESGCSTD